MEWYWEYGWLDRMYNRRQLRAAADRRTRVETGFALETGFKLLFVGLLEGDATELRGFLLGDTGGSIAELEACLRGGPTGRRRRADIHVLF